MPTFREIKFSHARTALKFSFKILGLKSGSVVLIPDFICESVLHPLYELNIKPCFYQIKDDMTPNWEELNTLVNNQTKAILMVHYFGQPQDIEKFKSFCDLNNLYLIEDNSHGHGGKYNGELLGSYGDVGFSSPRKILDLYCGGILYINRNDLDTTIIPHLPEYPVQFYNRILNFMTKHFLKFKCFIKKIIKKRPPFEDPRGFPEPMINDYFMDPSSKNKYDNTDWDKVREKRQKEYNKWYLFAKKNGLKPVFKDLHPEASPWLFPVYLNDQQQNITWFDWGWKNDCQVISWPTLPEEIIINNDSALKRWNKLICFQISHSNAI